MSRLTEISQLPAGKTCYQPITKDDTNHEWHTQNNECLTKLGKLEDLEDEIGMPILELFKAVKNGIYIIVDKNKKHIQFLNDVVINHRFDLHELYINKIFYRKHYNKTWFTDKSKAEERLKEIENER